MTGQSKIKALGEVALRLNNLPKMRQFYQDVLGLKVLGEFPTAVLLKITEDYGGHTQVLGLFDCSILVGPERTTVDHIASRRQSGERGVANEQRLYVEPGGFESAILVDQSIAIR